MRATYELLILVQDALSVSVARYTALKGQDLSPRPRLRLELNDGEPLLTVRAEDTSVDPFPRFFSGGDKTNAICFVPAKALELLCKFRWRIEGSQFYLQFQPNPDLPWDAALSVVRKTGTADRQIAVTNDLGHSNIFFAPISIPFCNEDTSDNNAAIALLDSELARNEEALFIPPISTAPRGNSSIVNESLQVLYGRFSTALAEKSGLRPPLIACLWALCANPIIRDVFIEYGWLEYEVGGRNERANCQVSLRRLVSTTGGMDKAVSDYRERFLRDMLYCDPEIHSPWTECFYYFARLFNQSFGSLPLSIGIGPSDGPTRSQFAASYERFVVQNRGKAKRLCSAVNQLRLVIRHHATRSTPEAAKNAINTAANELGRRLDEFRTKLATTNPSVQSFLNRWLIARSDVWDDQTLLLDKNVADIDVVQQSIEATVLLATDPSAALLGLLGEPFIWRYPEPSVLGVQQVAFDAFFESLVALCEDFDNDDRTVAKAVRSFSIRCGLYGPGEIKIHEESRTVVLSGRNPVRQSALLSLLLPTNWRITFGVYLFKEDTMNKNSEAYGLLR